MRVVRGAEKETQCLELYLDHPGPEGYKYGDLALQVGGISNSRQRNVIMSPVGLGPANHCAGEGQQQL
jgi:hypothetical protein